MGENFSEDIDEFEAPVTVGELRPCDLPPIEELTITAPKLNLVKVGKVESIVDTLVVIESLKTLPPLDIDTVLFDSEGRALGQVFDVFGCIKEPHYSVRFNDVDQIKSKDVQIDMEVFFLPSSDRNITKFAFINELQKIKGTDASWENDNEPPDGILEYSDDEEEQRAKREIKAKKRDKMKVDSQLSHM